MQKNSGVNVLSPVISILILISVFELFLRLPYVYFVEASGSTTIAKKFHFFSYQNPSDVMLYGCGIILLVLLCCLALSTILKPVYTKDRIRANFPLIPKTIYIAAFLFLGITFAALMSIGFEAINEDISSKRSELGESFVSWLLLRLSVFSHVIAVLFYIRMHQTGAKEDKIGFVLCVLLVVIPAVVFSVRAIVISFMIELVYLQILLGTFNMRKLGFVLLSLFPFLLLVSILRPDQQSDGIIDSILFGLDKIMQSRYFFDFSKLGAVTLWSLDQSWLGAVSLSFLLEPFFGDQIVFYKELGPMIGQEVYLLRGAGGVTPGGLLESVLSFGVIGGVLFFVFMIAFYLKVENMLFTKRRNSLFFVILGVLFISKFSLFLNSSLGAMVFQVVFETVLLIILFVIFGLLKKKVVR